MIGFTKITYEYFKWKDHSVFPLKQDFYNQGSWSFLPSGHSSFRILACEYQVTVSACGEKKRANNTKSQQLKVAAAKIET